MTSNIREPDNKEMKGRNKKAPSVAEAEGGATEEERGTTEEDNTEDLVVQFVDEVKIATLTPCVLFPCMAAAWNLTVWDGTKSF